MDFFHVKSANHVLEGGEEEDNITEREGILHVVNISFRKLKCWRCCKVSELTETTIVGVVKKLLSILRSGLRCGLQSSLCGLLGL